MRFRRFPCTSTACSQLCWSSVLLSYWYVERKVDIIANRAQTRRSLHNCAATGDSLHVSVPPPLHTHRHGESASGSFGHSCSPQLGRCRHADERDTFPRHRYILVTADCITGWPVSIAQAGLPRPADAWRVRRTGHPHGPVLLP